MPIKMMHFDHQIGNTNLGPSATKLCTFPAPETNLESLESVREATSVGFYR